MLYSASDVLQLDQKRLVADPLTLLVPTMIIPMVVDQHAEEAAFLWLLRGTAGTAPHYLLWELTRLENRLEAHLDGLRIAGEPGWEIIEKQLDANQGPGEVFVAALFAFEAKQQKRIDKVLEIAVPVPALRRGVISALGWMPQVEAVRHIQKLPATNAGLRHIGLGAALAHRINPDLALEKCLNDLDFSIRAYALRVVGIMGYAVWANHLRRELRSPDLGCRFAAAWSLARLTGEVAALSELQTIALAESKYRIQSVNMLVRRMEPAAARRLNLMLERLPGAERLAIFAAGALGDPAAIPALLDRMNQTAYARLAGESFSMITGLNLAVENMDGPIPPDHKPIPNEDPLDEHVEMDPDENLPWPILDKVQDWWNKNRQKYRDGVRYLVGQPLSEETCQAVLSTGYQRQRAMAALELGIRQPGQPLLNVTMPQR